MSYSVQEQVDPAALKAWNRYAQTPSQANLATLMAHLREDYPSFCALLVKVRPKGGGTVAPFLFNPVQRRMWRAIVGRIRKGLPPWFVILKFRQAGMSTFWCAWIFWQMWRQRDVQTMFVAHQLPTAETMIETMRVMFDELPDEFKPDLRDGNHGSTIPRGEVYFADRRSWCLIHLAKNVDPRGQQVTHVVETEFAMYRDPDELNGALLPQLPPFGSQARLSSSFAIESTPKGQNEFFDWYTDAKDGKIAFEALFFPWFLFEEQYSAPAPMEYRLSVDEKKVQARLSKARMEQYSLEDGGGVPVTRDQMYWRRMAIQTEYRGDDRRFDQEYPSDDQTCFLLASKSVFKTNSYYLLDCIHESAQRATRIWADYSKDRKAIVTKNAVRVKMKPKIEQKQHWTPISSVDFEIHPHGHWLVWEPPVAGHKYTIGADPAMGLEDSDNSAACVIDVTERRQVAEYAYQTAPEDFAVELAAAGYWYNQALLIPEINNLGMVVLKRLIANIMYPNLYRWPKHDEVNKFTNKRGWETNTRTKLLMVSSMINYIDERIMSIASRDLLNEMSTFEQTDEGDYFTFRAAKGRHDDRVMAFGLAIMGIDQTPTLVTEFMRGRQFPSAVDLHLASGAPQATPLPAKIQEMINVRHTIPWNPIGNDIAI